MPTLDRFVSLSEVFAAANGCTSAKTLALQTELETQ
jgi:hypothetical protein